MSTAASSVLWLINQSEEVRDGTYPCVQGVENATIEWVLTEPQVQLATFTDRKCILNYRQNHFPNLLAKKELGGHLF